MCTRDITSYNRLISAIRYCHKTSSPRHSLQSKSVARRDRLGGGEYHLLCRSHDRGSSHFMQDSVNLCWNLFRNQTSFSLILQIQNISLKPDRALRTPFDEYQTKVYYIHGYFRWIQMDRREIGSCLLYRQPSYQRNNLKMSLGVSDAFKAASSSYTC